MKQINKCDEKFWNWFSDAYAELPEGEDFHCNIDMLYEVWRRCWSCAYSVGRARGHRQGYMRTVGGPRFPMGYYVMEELFIGCKTGREFGLRIEKWHEIANKNDSKKNSNKPFSHLGCYSYPNCDEDPNGCFEQTAAEDIEEYGWKD